MAVGSRLIVKNLLFTVLVPGTVGGWVPLTLLDGAVTEIAALRVLSTVLFLCGGAIYAWCLWDFASFGRATPAPFDAPVHLVVRGLYRYSRNPMYVGVLTVILGWSAQYGSTRVLLYGMLVACGFQAFVVWYEEPTLARRFGAEYAAYRRGVGRWVSLRRPDDAGRVHR